MEYWKLCDVCDFQGGSQPPKDEWSLDRKEGFIRMLQIRDFTKTEKTTPEYVRMSNTTKICQKDDILIARYGASLGKILTGLAGAYNVAIMKTIPNSELLEKKYLYFFLKSPVFQNYLVNVGNRAAQAGFNKEDLQKLEIPRRSKKAQLEIVSLLESIERIITARKDEFRMLDELIKARFVEMFGNPALNDKGWLQKSLVELTTKIGSGATPKGGKEAYQNDGITLIRSMNVHNGKFEYKDLAHISDEQATKLDGVTVEEKDVLLNITGASVARCCIVPDEVLPARVNQHVCILRCRDCVSPVFLNYLLIDDNYQALLWSVAGSGATREAITKQQVENLQIILPPDELQIEFTSFVAQVDKSKVAVQKALDKTQLLFDSLMQRYFG